MSALSGIPEASFPFRQDRFWTTTDEVDGSRSRHLGAKV